ncbi:MAG: cytochrome c oxidase accessory protein CcoG [Bacteroidota bacterium]
MPATQFVDVGEVGILESPEAVLTTLDRDGKRKWLYPTPSNGRFWKRRLALGWALIVFFVALPIVRINGKPAVLLDVMAREFTLFGATFYPTDTFYLLLFGLSALVSVFLLTALLGRVWCGWGCPQTVYLEFVYRPIERWIEGPEHVRKRRNEGPRTLDWLRRRALKLTLYVVISVALAHVFVSYFVGWDRLLVWMQGDPREHWGYFVMMAGTSALILYDFGYFREQMCTIACPYARFQSVLMDEDSLIVSYDFTRGEPRGKGKKQPDGPRINKKTGQALGDCVDCYACVRTCPTGIDIRDGLQMECIACTQCIDACDAIMDKMDLPRGLIRYTSEHALDGQKTRVVRPRTVLYTLFFGALVTALSVGVATRGSYDVNVGRAVGQPFMELTDGTIANRLRFRVRNQTPRDVAFEIRALEPAAATLRIVGVQPIPLAPQEMTRVEVWVVVPAATFATDDEHPARFALDFDDGTVHEVDYVLLGPSE